MDCCNSVRTLEDVRDHFAAIDKYGTGRVSSPCFTDVLKNLFPGLQLSLSDRKAIQDKIGHDGDEDIPPELAHKYKDLCDTWGKCVEGFGLQANLGNYGHIITSGHTWEMLMDPKVRNLIKFCGQSYEATMGRVKADYSKSQGGGHGGGAGDKGRIIRKAEASERRWMRRWMSAFNGFKLADEGLLADLIRNNKDGGFTYGSARLKAWYLEHRYSPLSIFSLFLHLSRIIVPPFLYRSVGVRRLGGDEVNGDALTQYVEELNKRLEKTEKDKDDETLELLAQIIEEVD